MHFSCISRFAAKRISKVLSSLLQFEKFQMYIQGLKVLVFYVHYGFTSYLPQSYLALNAWKFRILHVNFDLNTMLHFINLWKFLIFTCISRFAATRVSKRTELPSGYPNLLGNEKNHMLISVFQYSKEPHQNAVFNCVPTPPLSRPSPIECNFQDMCSFDPLKSDNHNCKSR